MDIFKKCRTPWGIKQGCPLSALLFRIVAEISATKLDSNENIVRFRINDWEFWNSDDLTIPVQDKMSFSDSTFWILEKNLKLTVFRKTCVGFFLKWYILQQYNVCPMRKTCRKRSILSSISLGIRRKKLNVLIRIVSVN